MTISTQEMIMVITKIINLSEYISIDTRDLVLMILDLDNDMVVNETYFYLKNLFFVKISEDINNRVMKYSPEERNVINNLFTSVKMAVNVVGKCEDVDNILTFRNNL